MLIAFPHAVGIHVKELGDASVFSMFEETSTYFVFVYNVLIIVGNDLLINGGCLLHCVSSK